MRFLIFICVFALVLTLGGAARADSVTHFSSVIDDLPLMAGISEVGDGVEFSTPDGRIAEVAAEGDVRQADVLAFYDATLPQLGWRRTGEGAFEREGETLRLKFEPVEGGILIRFAVAPTEN